eukprot:SAG11_NODE_22106_length_412_cov_0.753994_2_plen_74_part_01
MTILSASVVASFAAAAAAGSGPIFESSLLPLGGTVESDSRALRAHEIRVSLAQQSAANAVIKAALRDLGPQRSE